jgi:cytochrome c biogenesis protein ResB
VPLSSMVTDICSRTAQGKLYGFKGLVGKLGPIGVHASLLAIMAGVAYGGLGGFKGSAMIPEGGDFVIAQAIRPLSSVASLPEGTCSRWNATQSVRQTDGNDSAPTTRCIVSIAQKDAAALVA